MGEKNNTINVLLNLTETHVNDKGFSCTTKNDLENV